MDAEETGAPSTLHVVLLRRDLRVLDQPALSRAAAACAADESSKLLVTYVYDPALLRHPTASTAHFLFIDDSLAEVASDLQARGSALFLRSGHLLGVLESFRRLAGGRPLILWSNRVVGVAAERQRDAQTATWCEMHGVVWHDLPSNGVIPHEDCAHAWQDETFQQLWAHELEEHCAADEESLPTTSQRMPPPPEGLRLGSRLSMEALARLGASNQHGVTRECCQRGGTRAGRQLLSSFLEQRSLGYRSKLSSPVTAETACSRLSPHLAWGTLSLRQVVRALAARGAALHAAGGARNREWLVSIEGFRMRLHWRSHNMQKFEAMPHAETSNLVSGYDGLRDEGGQSDDVLAADELLSARPGRRLESCVQSDEPLRAGPIDEHVPLMPALLGLNAPTLQAAEISRRFQAWATGRTGYPLVDACMRCLDTTGWLTFRMRCLCVSFACYHLWLHWRRPALWLARRFVDFEPGIHFCQMQMQAGCAEYVEMRVYNPIKQAQDQDPNGTFIRKWVPELFGVPLQYLHEPMRMPKGMQREVGCVLGVDYPRPLVEHQQAYARAKHLLQQRRNAMGMTSTTGRAVAARRAQATQPSGSCDLRELFCSGCTAATSASDADSSTSSTTTISSTRASGSASARDRKRERDDEGETVVSATVPVVETSLSSTASLSVDETPPAAIAAMVLHAVDATRDEEMRTCAKLSAAGFPPELARRAASAYPTNVERAADWILSAEW